MKKILSGLSLLLLLVGCTSNSTSTTASDLPVIGIVQLVEHTSLNIIKEAIMDELDQLGYRDKENCVIKFVNAQGDVSSLPTIMQNMHADDVDVLIAITTPVAQAAMNISDDIPVIFSAVSDPVKAGILKELNDTSANVTGTSDPIKVEAIMDFALSIHPDTKTVGYIYNAGESNSISALEKLEAYAEENNLALEITTITSSSELQSATSAIADKVDIIFVSNDNTVAEAMPILVAEALKYNLPVYTGADSMVMDGGFATVGIDYVDVGIETAKMADLVLKGTSTGDIPVEMFDTKLNIYVNKNTADKLSIVLSEELLNSDNFVLIGE